MTLVAIQDEALRLSPEQRSALIDVLSASLFDAQTSSHLAAWTKECEQRIDAAETGSISLHDAEAVIRDLRLNLKK